MTGRILIIGSGSGNGRHLAALLAVSATSLGRAIFAEAKRRDEAAARGRLEAAFAALGLTAIDSAAKFRDLAEALAKYQVAPVNIPVQRAGAPAFGSARPYLKKKKGRS